MSDKPPPHQAGEQVGERGPGRRAEAHRREGEREREEEARYYGEENASRYGEGLEEHISAEETPKDLSEVLFFVVRQDLAQEFCIF